VFFGYLDGPFSPNIKGVNMFIVIGSPRKKREIETTALPPFIEKPKSLATLAKTR
jgi:hypothetical protein